MTSKSTGQHELQEAVKVVESMLRNGGQKTSLGDTVLSDDEFEEIQRRHYAKKTGPIEQERSLKSLRECLDAISAFREISGLTSVALATPDDCERFQRDALQKPKNWRVKYADKNQPKRPVEKLSANTVVKWSTALQAAFERANRKGGKKCVRGVVAESKLIDDNPWRNFTWIEGFEKTIRQFDPKELISLLDYFDTKWPGVTVAPAFVKVMLWSWSRKLEVSSLKWSGEKKIDVECHFESTGKWNVTKWFRLPTSLRAELECLKTDSDFVFGCYSEQVRKFHEQHGQGRHACNMRGDFLPENLGDWMHHRVKEWSKTLPNGSAYLHVFRKTTLQHALSGEHIEQAVAEEAHVTPAVMRASYARSKDAEFRRMSNRTYERIRASLPVEVAVRYGFKERPEDRLKEQLDLARSQGDWAAVARIADELNRCQSQAS